MDPLGPAARRALDAAEKEYDQQKVIVRQLADVVKPLAESMARAATAFTEAFDAFNLVQKRLAAFLDEVPPAHIQLRRLQGEMSRNLAAARTKVIPDVLAAINFECLHRLKAFEQDVKLVELAKDERRRVVANFESALSDLYDKEKEYMKKQKNLLGSKEYPKLLGKFQDTEAEWKRTEKAFLEQCAELAERKDYVLAGTMQCFLEHTCHLFGAAATALGQTFETTAQNTHYNIDVRAPRPSTSEALSQ
jgi:hypothetical protein